TCRGDLDPQPCDSCSPDRVRARSRRTALSETERNRPRRSLGSPSDVRHPSDTRRHLGATQGLPAVSLALLRLLEQPLGEVVLDAALRQSLENSRLPRASTL